MTGPEPSLWPPGHFYSPIPALDRVRADEARIFAVPPSLPGIDLRRDDQLAMAARLAGLAATQPFSGPPSTAHRYHFDNEYFSYGDGLVLYAMLRWARPRRVIEIGSGYSSALILDTVELGPDDVSCTFVEPHPERLMSLLRPGDDRRCAIIGEQVEQVPLAEFRRLEAGDVLFIDSSHVVKVGGDVNHLFFEVLPILRPGVLVHVHDVFYPFEYPRHWVYEGRAWSESYLLRAFLSFNTSFRIVVWNDFLATFARDVVSRLMPLWARNPGGSIWLTRR